MNDYQPCHMLITGGAGFIGSHFIRYVMSRQPKLKIVNLDLLTYAGSLQNLEGLMDNPRHHFVHGDIRDKKLLDQLLRDHQIDTIVHFAAESHVDRSIINPAAFVETNVLGTLSLLEAARHYWLETRDLSPTRCRFHHISTDEVYGALTEDEPAFTESTPLAPNSPYSASKAGADHLVRAYFKTYGLPVTLTNCSNNYGPNQHPEKLIPTIIRCCLNGQPIPIYGNGKNKRDWLYVVDHCDAIDKVVRQGRVGEKYNIGVDGEFENLDIARQVCAIMDKLSPKPQPHANLITFVTDRPGHDWRYAMNSAKIYAELGWLPSVSLEQGLLETVNWFINK